MPAVHPEADKRFSRAALALGDLGLVVRENIILTAAVDIEFRPEDSRGHRTAFDVPTGASPAPRALPTHIAIGFAPRFPERKIADIFLLVFVIAHANPVAQILEMKMGQVAVIRKRADPKIHRSIVSSVGVAFFHKSRNHRDHSLDVDRLRGFRKMIRALDAKGIQVVEEGLLEGRGEIRQRQARRTATPDRLVVHIGEVHRAIDPVASEFQMPLEQIFKNISPEVSDMGEIVNRGTAGVETHHPRLARSEVLDLAGQRVEKTNRHEGVSKVAQSLKINSGKIGSSAPQGSEELEKKSTATTQFLDLDEFISRVGLVD